MEYYKAQAIIFDVRVTSNGEGKSICFRVLLRDTGISPRYPRIDVKAIDQQITPLANDFLGRFAQNSSVTVKNPLIERLVSLEQQVAELASSAKVGVAAEDRAIPRYGKKTALLVGCNAVADSSLPALKSAESDAQSLNSVLSAQWGFETELIVGSKATRASILARLAAVGEKLTDEDLLVCYFGGYSTERLNGASKIVTYIPYDYSNQIYLTGDDILKALGPSPARHKLVLFDGCHATSGIPRGHTSASNGAGNAPVTMWFGACLPHQFSGESEAGGIFTQAVLRSLREGVESGKDHVWISQLASSVRQKMPPHQTADLLWVAGDGEVCFGAEVTR
jgi:hypothetical protein